MQGLKFCHLFLFDSKLSACCSYNQLITVETFTSPYGTGDRIRTCKLLVLSEHCIPFQHRGDSDGCGRLGQSRTAVSDLSGLRSDR